MRKTTPIAPSGLRIRLPLHPAILLICSCVAQMIVVCVNPGKFDGFKGWMAVVSLLCLVRLFLCIRRSTDSAACRPLLLRLLVFAGTFLCVLLLTNRLLGGVISMLFCILLLMAGLKIVPDP